MTKLCLKSFRYDGLPFAEGCTYEVEYNPIANKLIIYNPWGYTSISKELLNKYFI